MIVLRDGGRLIIDLENQINYSLEIFLFDLSESSLCESFYLNLHKSSLYDYSSANLQSENFLKHRACHIIAN